MKARAFQPVVALLFAAPILVGTLKAQSYPFAIYNYRGTSTTSGGGSNVAAITTGYLALELDGKATYVGLIASGPKNNRKVSYQTNRLTNNFVTSIGGPKNKIYTVIARAEAPGPTHTNFTVALYQAKAVGLESRLTVKTDVDPPYTVPLPKVFKSSSFAMVGDTSSTERTIQQSGTFTFNSALTLAFNNADFDVSDFISTRTNSQEFAGIPETSAPAP